MKKTPILLTLLALLALLLVACGSATDGTDTAVANESTTANDDGALVKVHAHCLKGTWANIESVRLIGGFRSATHAFQPTDLAGPIAEDEVDVTIVV